MTTTLSPSAESAAHPAPGSARTLAVATSADFVPDLLGWQGVWWGMTEDSVAELLAEHLVPVFPPGQFAYLYAPFKGVLAIGPYHFDSDSSVPER